VRGARAGIGVHAWLTTQQTSSCDSAANISEGPLSALGKEILRCGAAVETNVTHNQYKETI